MIIYCTITVSILHVHSKSSINSTDWSQLITWCEKNGGSVGDSGNMRKFGCEFVCGRKF